MLLNTYRSPRLAYDAITHLVFLINLPARIELYGCRYPYPERPGVGLVESLRFINCCTRRAETNEVYHIRS